MNFLRPVTFFLLLFLSIPSFAQEVTDPAKGGNNIITGTAKVGDEVMPWVPLPNVTVTARMTAAERARLNRLRYNVLKVLPYAKYARERYAKLQKDLAVTGNHRDQKKLVKQCDQQIKDMFNKEIKKMSISQGEILIKLIDRETGYTSYDLVKELKGNFTAFFYQSIARVVGHNLKAGYDKEEEREIENIIRASGYNYYN